MDHKHYRSPTSLIMWLLGLMFLAGSSIAAGENYPNSGYFGSDPDEDAEWYEQCMAVKDIKPDRKDMPSDEASASLLKCNPVHSYYDTLNMERPSKTDWMRVVHCAHVKKENEVLAMLYANGFGVQRNLRLALRYSCETPSAPAEMEGRVEHLTNMMNSGLGATNTAPFDMCDDITSGMMQGVCAGIEEYRRNNARIAQLKSLVSSWSAAQKTSFVQLKTAMETFADARGANETDMSGTARGAMATAAESAELDLFLNDIKQFEGGGMPVYTAEELKSYDRRLNVVYQKIMRAKINSDYFSGLGGTTISKESVKQTQRLWLKYRDAYVAFGAKRYSGVSAESWMALLTKRRVEQLEEIYGYTEF